MKMPFAAYGPFQLESEGNYVSLDALEDFWANVDMEGLDEAIGVYIISVRHGSSTKPWYVGKTDDCFRRRLRSHAIALKLFAELKRKAPKGSIEVAFLARRNPNNSGFKTTGKNKLDSINFLENLLIGECYFKNPRLLNVQKISLYKNVSVPGFMNDERGARTASAKYLSKLLNTF